MPYIGLTLVILSRLARESLGSADEWSASHPCNNYDDCEGQSSGGKSFELLQIGHRIRDVSPSAASRAASTSSTLHMQRPGAEVLVDDGGLENANSFNMKFGAVPTFEPTYDMRRSTIVMTCNYSGFMEHDRVEHKFGIVDYDWSNAKQLWVNMMPMDAEELLVKQAIMRKAAACPKLCPLPHGCTTKNACPEAKVWVYRNLVKALPWFASVRKKLDDPAYSGFFLSFGDGNVSLPRCDAKGEPPKCSDFYHDQLQTPHERGGHAGGPGGFVNSFWEGVCEGTCDCGRVPCGEYLWDHRNGSMLRDFLVNEFIGGKMGLQNPNIDGFFIDDVWQTGRPSEVANHPLKDLGLSVEDGHRIEQGWKDTTKDVHSFILENGAFSWQQFQFGPSTGAGPLVTKRSCTSNMREFCRAESKIHNASMFYGFAHGVDLPATRARHINFEEDLAAFLLIRGPYAWLGHSWIGCHYHSPGLKQQMEYSFPKALEVDYGVPLDVCKETYTGSEVFVRKWSKAVVELDCKVWKGSIHSRKQ